MFYEGNWRPHFREYSKKELFQLLQWSGFEVLEHEFYEADFGMYFKNKKNIIKIDNRKFSTKGKIVDLARKLLISFIPSLRDNHILLAKKNMNYEDVLNESPQLTNTLKDWNEQRNKFNK